MWYDQAEEVTGRRVSMHYRRSAVQPSESRPFGKQQTSYLQSVDN